MKLLDKLKAKAEEAKEAFRDKLENGHGYVELLQELHNDTEEPASDFASYRSKMSAKEATCLAAHVYGTYPDSLLQDGWRQTSELDHLIAFSSDELKASLYVKVKRNQKMYAYCFAGTESTSGKDWANNIYQMLGLSYDYAKAVKNAKILSKKLKKGKLFFVGHSKGGGEAILCSLVTGRPSIVFNPAPVSNLSKFLNNVKSAKNVPVDVYVSKNDPLYNTDGILKLLGFKMALFSKAIGIKVDGEIHELDMKGITSLYKEHSITCFLKYFHILSSEGQLYLCNQQP